ncbi:MAG: elongation factor P [Chlamydiales bacterium]|nr:elongation factor P [Chlamydiales bacterium]
MVASSQISPGMILSIDKNLFRVESSVKVTVPKGPPFIKAKLRNLSTEKVTERNFKVGQEVEEVTLEERRLEYLYLEGKSYFFLDVGNLEQVFVPPEIVGERANYLKEGVEVEATFYGDRVFSLELPQFLELMVSKTPAAVESAQNLTNATKEAVLETGAAIEVPPFIEAGDVIKVDTRTNEYIQRV